MTKIDISQVLALAPQARDQYVRTFSAPNAGDILDKYGISKSALRVCHFMGQVLAETGELKYLVESLNYSAAALMKTWPKRFPTEEIAAQYAHDEQRLGNFVYANRLGNGDAASGDGFKYRGRGLLQITGKRAYTLFGARLGFPLAADPDLAFDPAHCLEIAAAEWAVSGYQGRFCNDLADRDDIKGVTHAINGGLIGLDDRIAQLERCKQIWLTVGPALASRGLAHLGEEELPQAAAGAVHSYLKHPSAAAPVAPQAEQPAPLVKCEPYFKRPKRKLGARIPGDARSWNIGDLCQAYSWPSGLPGGGVIAIVELDGGYVDQDIANFFAQISQPAPAIANVSIDGAANNPGQHIGEEADPDIEVTMDIQVAAAAYAIATGQAAQVRVYWAPNQPGAIAKAVRQATADGCDACSISWGADEAIWKSWSTSDIDYVEDMEKAASDAAAAGMIVFAAAGDNDSSDGGPNAANVDVPSSCPSVVGCGGTTKTRASETVWNNTPGQPSGEGTGGGYSDYFPPPPWQASAPQIGQDPPRRMVPDVAANADPNTGYNLLVHGAGASYGGTSAVAPLYAGVFAAFGTKLAPVAPTLWGHEECFTDIVTGDNGAFSAQPGPDPCTGLGVPIGVKLAALFAKGAAAQPSERAVALAAPAAAAPFDPAAAVQYGLFVSAAYSMFAKNPNDLYPDPTSDFPAGYRLVGWVHMNDFIIHETGPVFYGFVAQSVAEPNRFVLAIRGTQTLEEAWDDLTSLIRTPFGVAGGGSVGDGFNRIYKTMEIVEKPTGAAVAPRSLRAAGGFSKQTAALVTRLAAGVPAAASITVTGHSLGAALATLYTMENAHNDKIHNPTICTFASPRVGDATFVAAFSALPLTSWRIYNAPDVVPMLPPDIVGFQHVGVAERYDSILTTLPTILCWHSLATYLSLLDPNRKPDPGCRLPFIAPAVPAGALEGRAAAVGEGGAIKALVRIASDPASLQEAQQEAARRLLALDREHYPHNGCAITLAVLLQAAGIDAPDTFQAIALGSVLERRGWRRIPLGEQEAGDVGSTCGAVADPGVDHIYLVLRRVNPDEMVIADNQAPSPHFRFVSGRGKAPTKFFLRAPASGA